MEYTMFKERQNDHESFGRYGRWACRVGGSAQLILGLLVSYWTPTQGLPIGGHPDKCQRPCPSGGL